MRNLSLQKNACKLALEPIESEDRSSHDESHRGVALNICGNASSHFISLVDFQSTCRAEI